MLPAGWHTKLANFQFPDVANENAMGRRTNRRSSVVGEMKRKKENLPCLFWALDALLVFDDLAIRPDGLFSQCRFVRESCSR